MPRSGRLPAEQPRKRLIRTQSNTDPRFGKEPSQRSLVELLDAGVVVLDKPSGPSSHQVTAWLRNALGVTGVGHGGTLDPNVTGVLPITINRGRGVVQALLNAGKEYVAVMRLHEDRSEDEIHKTARRFTGKIEQTPPVRSAVARRRRFRRVYYLDVMEISGRDVLFRVGCQAGTYIRNLCVDMAAAMGTRGHMQELRRTRTGLLHEDQVVTLHDCLDARILHEETGDESELRRCILPIEEVTKHLPKLVLRDSAIDSICHGAPLAVAGIAQVDSSIEENELVAMESLKGELIGLARTAMVSRAMVESTKGVAANSERVIMRKGTYPRVWKRR